MVRLHSRFMASLLAAVLSVFATGASAQDRLDVVATTGMIADAAREVGGDLVEVAPLSWVPALILMPTARRGAISSATANADLVLWHGLYLEAQMEEFLIELGETRPVVAVADQLPRNLLISHDDYADRSDPHVWMNPNLWSRVVLEVRDALTEVHPDGRDTFHANTEAYLEELSALAQYTQQVLGTVPAESRVLLSAHDAFNYFGSAYGFEVTGIQGISTESEAGLQRISELVDMLVDGDIRAVFVESSVSDRNIRALIEGAAARGHEVVIGGSFSRTRWAKTAPTRAPISA
jgi:manganese/zinc/iron transport system substrate-binding protein